MESAMVVSGLQILALFSLCLSATTFSIPAFDPSMLSGPSIPHNYTRFADVERHCQSVLSSAAELSADGILMHRLSFMNADWSQDAGEGPLLPFQGSYADAPAVAGSELLGTVPLASFKLSHMDTVQPRGTRTALNVSGFLTITRNYCCPTMEEHASSPEFELRPGFAKLHVSLEGVYTETRSSGSDASDGERVLCMVGNAVLPVRGSNSSDPWDWAKTDDGSRNFKLPVMADGNILLVLRYPKAHTMRTRAVRGEMMSTSAKSGRMYFDTVRLVSGLSRNYSSYQFRQEDEELDVMGCSKHPSVGDGNGTEHLYRGAYFCDILHQFTSYDKGVLTVVPNWNCNSTEEFCGLLGPIDTRRPATCSTRYAIAVQDLQCDPSDRTATARVSAVFRFLLPWEHQPTAAMRTGLSGMTLSAEGVWSASTGHLCMVGCLGAGMEACHYVVTLYVPMAFSITRRGIIVGQITTTDGSHPSLSFQQQASPGQTWGSFVHKGESLSVAYNYTKVKQASEILRGSKLSRFRDNFIVRSFLSYPTIAADADDMVNLSNLADNLSLRLLKPQVLLEELSVELQILSISTLVGRYYPQFQDGPSMQVEQIDRGHAVDKQQILNVSAELRASTMFPDSSLAMSLEGVYSPEDGRMYLIGCRSVHASWQVLSTSRDLEDGMDCSIAVTVQYPPTTTQWLFSPVAKVCIASTRDAGDPLHFNRTEYRTLPVIYRDQREVMTEPTMEGLLYIAMMSGIIVVTLVQLHYIKTHADVAPYISLVMLGVQALGYGATLVTEANMLSPRLTPNYRTYPDNLHRNMDLSVKALTLASLLLTVWLAEKVWLSRALARARSPLEPRRAPSDSVVLMYSFAVHMGGLFFVLAVHWLSTYGTWTTLPPRVIYFDAQGTSSHMRTGGTVVEQYVTVVREWFLLPQVIGNVIWRVNCKPLAVRYYAGITTVWLLPHIYGYLRPHMVSMYYVTYDDAKDVYSMAGTVVVPVVGVMLALAVFVQQRWNYKIVGWAMRAEQNKLQHVY